MQKLPKVQVFKGDTYSVNVSLKANNVLQDIQGFTVFYTVKTDYDTDTTDNAAVIKQTLVIPTGTPVTLQSLTLSSSQTNITTGEYIYDIQLKDTAGAILTIGVGRFIINDAVTNRIT